MVSSGTSSVADRGEPKMEQALSSSDSSRSIAENWPQQNMILCLSHRQGG